MKALTKEEVTCYLELHLRDWTFDGNAIKRDFVFKTFVEAFSFMTVIALLAEKLDHHPSWSNEYNRVSISLSTHSSKGITQLDFDLAGIADMAYKRCEVED
ncbi:4a-hydroxytetrahydrobiopterin dehydratase [uncultured Acetobacteroides sp.]|uniref:4a-hydroxytetrahydrobiopterin dehydratase n=1 Tax=uncultured Acetobacteroides sp. TaxID=1760811 RepID=UPI0029F4C404|nr:4a-hydroxytetrahydrobiopterin dehydratase [uncultured Acetobacteroides sp.]